MCRVCGHTVPDGPFVVDIQDICVMCAHVMCHVMSCVMFRVLCDVRCAYCDFCRDIIVVSASVN